MIIYPIGDPIVSGISHLLPTSLWQIFSQICSIPHPSYHEEALAQYIVNLAKQHNLFVERDQAGNILIRKPATHGMENRKPVILQAHLDMVPQKNSNIQHDFIHDPIKPYVDGEWVKAQGTTLGADNGIGLASALAILFDKDSVHGPLEVLLTMTEEVGMEGAFGLQPNWLQGDILINTDSETEGEIYTGCAGGVNVTIDVDINYEPIAANYQPVELHLKGLKGGHSGADIHLGLGNANKLIARLLAHYMQQAPIRLITITGGSLRNAIPREAIAVVAVPREHIEQLQHHVELFLNMIRQELAIREPNLLITCKPISSSEQVLSIDSNNKIINLLNSLPNGVIRMNDVLPDIVETSLNIGVVKTTASQISITCLVRSLIDSGKLYVTEMLTSLAELTNSNIVIDGDYPGWQPNPDSDILKQAIQIYKQLFDAEPSIKVIHAGLECGLFKKPYPDVDMISIGPTIRSPHSPDERVHINSVNRYWQLLTALLKAIPLNK